VNFGGIHFSPRNQSVLKPIADADPLPCPLRLTRVVTQDAAKMLDRLKSKPAHKC
jgi:hypothetical protein